MFSAFEKHKPLLLWILRSFLLLIAAIPPLFVYVMMTRSAILVPHWDHCEIYRMFVRYHDGSLMPGMFWAPHNHTRPLTYRIVVFFTGILTDWDIRAEYVYLYGSLIGTFAILGRTLWHAAGGSASLVFFAALCVLSILVFSPTGHHNHWWSMMIQLTFAHLLIAASLSGIALQHDTWQGHAKAAVCCWLATYTLTNGLAAFFACALIAQLALKQPCRLHWRTVFWVVNIVLILILYLPGLSENLESGKVPGAKDFTKFSLAYLGSPATGIISFPYKHFVDPPANLRINMAAGALLLLLFGVAAVRWRGWLLERSKVALLVVGFAVFSLLSAGLTAYGRALFAGGLNNANESRYTLFSSYLLYSGLFWVVHWLSILKYGSNSILKFAAPAAWVFFFAFTAMAARTYWCSIPIYEEAHALNKQLMATYIWKNIPTANDSKVYPDQTFVLEMRAQMRRLHLGPYRFAPPDSDGTQSK